MASVLVRELRRDEAFHDALGVWCDDLAGRISAAVDSSDDDATDQANQDMEDYIVILQAIDQFRNAFASGFTDVKLNGVDTFVDGLGDLELSCGALSVVFVRISDQLTGQYIKDRTGKKKVS